MLSQQTTSRSVFSKAVNSASYADVGVMHCIIEDNIIEWPQKCTSVPEGERRLSLSLHQSTLLHASRPSYLFLMRYCEHTSGNLYR